MLCGDSSVLPWHYLLNYEFLFYLKVLGMPSPFQQDDLLLVFIMCRITLLSFHNFLLRTAGQLR